MKKKIAVVIVGVLLLSSLWACSNKTTQGVITTTKDISTTQGPKILKTENITSKDQYESYNYVMRELNNPKITKSYYSDGSCSLDIVVSNNTKKPEDFLLMCSSLFMFNQLDKTENFRHIVVELSGKGSVIAVFIKGDTINKVYTMMTIKESDYVTAYNNDDYYKRYDISSLPSSR